MLLDSVLASSVLIETYWNVKQIHNRTNDREYPCINRNILECKGLPGSQRPHRDFRINRNILECKDFSTIWNGRQPFCINRNILECKV